jgi:hypothetical protein
MQRSKVSLCKFVKNLCILGAVIISVNTPLEADVVLFEDSFDGAILDANKWMGSGNQANGQVSGTIIAKPAFSASYEIFGKITLPMRDISLPGFTVHLRSGGWSDSQSAMPDFDISGIALVFYNSTPSSPGDVLILSDPWQSPNPLAPPFFASYGPISWNTNQENEFHIIDNGSAIKLFVNNLEIFNVNTDYSIGNFLGFTSDDGFLNYVKIIPEPSALSLLAVGLSALAMMRRRRS